MIYGLVFESDDVKSLRLLQTCKQIYNEAGLQGFAATTFKLKIRTKNLDDLQGTYWPHKRAKDSVESDLRIRMSNLSDAQKSSITRLVVADYEHLRVVHKTLHRAGILPEKIVTQLCQLDAELPRDDLASFTDEYKLMFEDQWPPKPKTRLDKIDINAFELFLENPKLKLLVIQPNVAYDRCTKKGYTFEFTRQDNGPGGDCVTAIEGDTKKYTEHLMSKQRGEDGSRVLYTLKDKDIVVHMSMKEETFTGEALKIAEEVAGFRAMRAILRWTRS